MILKKLKLSFNSLGYNINCSNTVIELDRSCCACNVLLEGEVQTAKTATRTNVFTKSSALFVLVAKGGTAVLKPENSELKVRFSDTVDVVTRRVECCSRCNLIANTSRVVKVCSVEVGGFTTNKRD